MTPASVRAAGLLGVVLAGGRSSRMGTDKAMLPHPNTSTTAGDGLLTYLQYAVARLKPLAGRVVVSGGDESGDADGLQDQAVGLGPAMGVLTCLRYAADHGYDAVLVTPVDMPHLRTEHLAQLVSAWKRHRCIVSACFSGGFTEPLVAIYPLSALSSLEQLATSPRRSLSDWLKHQSDLSAVHTVELPAEASKNVNQPSDL
jgi:molybdenum cofactor guanylyltransferase